VFRACEVIYLFSVVFYFVHKFDCTLLRNITNGDQCQVRGVVATHVFDSIYRGADKSLARPGRKQATATEDFDFHIYYL